MNRQERMKKYGEDAYMKILAQMKERYKKDRAKYCENSRRRRAANPERVTAESHEQNRKGGKYYEKAQEYERTRLRRERRVVRGKHAKKWRPYKNIIAPGSQLHHQWHSGNAKYTGLALVEADAHMHRIIKVIRILEGAITIYTEAGIRGDERGKRGGSE